MNTNTTHTPGLCPSCGTQRVSTGAPMWEAYCPNKECTHDRDEFFEQLKFRRLEWEKAEIIREAAPELLTALKECLGVFDAAKAKYPDVTIGPRTSAAMERARSAIRKAEGQS